MCSGAYNVFTLFAQQPSFRPHRSILPLVVIHHEPLDFFIRLENEHNLASHSLVQHPRVVQSSIKVERVYNKDRKEDNKVRIPLSLHIHTTRRIDRRGHRADAKLRQPIPSYPSIYTFGIQLPPPPARQLQRLQYLIQTKASTQDVHSQFTTFDSIQLELGRAAKDGRRTRRILWWSPCLSNTLPVFACWMASDRYRP
jgi:hypothetical protein